ncbi:MAG: hypothetical protein BWY11_02466 [Firmicutes bacterium ADurb.Bin182]|nr:MAG: hypothetical protein BWY11_02466 [Firmicutes bacterium ADurb.Bin182]
METFENSALRYYSANYPNFTDEAVPAAIMIADGMSRSCGGGMEAMKNAVIKRRPQYGILLTGSRQKRQKRPNDQSLKERRRLYGSKARMLRIGFGRAGNSKTSTD